MRRHAPLIVTALLVAAGAAALWYGYYAERVLGPPPEVVARQLVAAFAEFEDPEQAIEGYPDVCSKHFANGEWIFGVGIDSHSWKRARNTLVLKDSRGRVCVLSGHVCGPRWLEHNSVHFKSLDEFYLHMKGRFVDMGLPRH